MVLKKLRQINLARACLVGTCAFMQLKVQIDPKSLPDEHETTVLLTFSSCLHFGSQYGCSISQLTLPPFGLHVRELLMVFNQNRH